MFNYFSTRLFNHPPPYPYPHPPQYQPPQHPPQQYYPTPFTTGPPTSSAGAAQSSYPATGPSSSSRSASESKKMAAAEGRGGERRAEPVFAPDTHFPSHGGGPPQPRPQDQRRQPHPPTAAEVPPGNQQRQQQQQQQQRQQKQRRRKGTKGPEFDRDSAFLVEVPPGVGEGDSVVVRDVRGGTFMARVPPLADLAEAKAKAVAVAGKGAEARGPTAEEKRGRRDVAEKRYMMIVPPDALKAVKRRSGAKKRRKKQGQASSSATTSSASSPTSSDSDAAQRKKYKSNDAAVGGPPSTPVAHRSGLDQSRPLTPVTNHHRSWRRGRPPRERSSQRLREMQEPGGGSRRGGDSGGGGRGQKRWIYYEKKSSRVGKSYQAMDLPKAGSFAQSEPSESYISEQLWDAKRAGSNAREVDEFMQSLSTESKGLGMIAMHKANYDPAKANSVILEMEERTDSSSHVGGWIETFTEAEKAAFHQAIMSHSRKNFRVISSKVGKNMNACLKYYYGEFKRHDDYKTLRLLNDLDECHICRDGGVLIYCDNCNNPYHLDCLRPPLPAVPEGDWFCDFCIARGATRKKSLPSPGKPAHRKHRITEVGGKKSPQSSFGASRDDLTLPESFPFDDRDARKEQSVATRTPAICEKGSAQLHLLNLEAAKQNVKSVAQCALTAGRHTVASSETTTEKVKRPKVIYEVLPPVPPPKSSPPGPFRTRPAVFV